MATKTLEVSVPAGIDNGQTIRISGQGAVPVRGGVNGDLYVTVHVTPHKRLKRDGSTVRSTETISYLEAILGTTRTTPTLQGEQDITIPAGTQPKTELRLSGLGFPDVRGTGRRGDHLVTIDVEIPKKITRKQRELLEQVQASGKRRRLF